MKTTEKLSVTNYIYDNYNERRLILLAILKAKGDLEKAYNINAPSQMSFEAYSKKVYRYGIRKKFLKSLFNSK